MLEFTPITQLNSSQNGWKIRALISRIWDYYPRDKPGVILGMEIICVDEKGDRIQASIKQKLISKFKSILKEGEFRDIMNFEVLPNNGDYRGTSHPYKINFLFTTCMKVCETIPNLSRFCFTPFPEIEAQIVDDVFIDILGEIVGMSEIMEKAFSGKLSKLLEIQLQDLCGAIIGCTLWDKHAEDVHSFVKKNNTGQIVLLGSLMRIKKFNGKLSVQNSHFSTKIFLNADIREISEFRNKMIPNDTSVSLGVLPIATPTLEKKNIESFPLSSWKTINQFQSSTEQTTCVAFATITSFQKELPWFYIGCTTCFSTATPYFNPDTEQIEVNKYSCLTCEKNETKTSIRYKVHVKVADHTGSTSFLLFDREVIQLIQRSAYELLEQQVQFNREGEIPQELLNLEGKNFVSIIRVNGKEKYYRCPTYKVVKLSEDPECIQKFHDNVVFQDSTHSEMPLISSTSTSIQMDCTSSEANINELPLSSPVTPATKRQRPDICEDNGVEESSTKLKSSARILKRESDNKGENVKNKYSKGKR